MSKKYDDDDRDRVKKARKDHGMKPFGYCLYCNEAVPVNYVFCCSECSKDWTAEQKLKGK